MSSPANSPYKSRLFGFLNRQSLQIKDRFEKTGRQIKVALEWGVQILAYPVYMLVQTGRMAGRQLGQTVERGQLPASVTRGETQQEPPISDKPVSRVLQAIEPWLSATLEETRSPELKELLLRIPQPLSISKTLENNLVIEPAPHSTPQTTASQNSSIVVKGVASNLETRHLVLITPDNQVLDILSPEQQKQLQKRIYWEISNYWYEYRSQQEAAQKFPELVSSFEQENENVLPPARLFWKAMRWLQTSQVARAVNLFGESRLVNSHANQVNNTISFPDYPQLAQQLNNHFDELNNSRSRNVSQGDSVSIGASQTVNLWNVREIVQAAVDYFFGKQPTQDLPSQEPSATLFAGESQKKNILPQAVRDSPIETLRERVPNLVRKLQTNLNLPQKSSQLPKTAEPDPFQIQTIIQAAIDYFFGQRQEQVSLSGEKTSKASPAFQPQKQSNSALPAHLEDPWLSWDDLYTEQTIEKIDAPKVNLVRSASATPVKSQKNSSEIRDPKVAQQHQSISELEQSAAIISSSVEEYSLEIDPDWIEIKATTTGYVKHPLVKLLEWLDRLMLWLEDSIASFWKWLKRRF